MGTWYSDPTKRQVGWDWTWDGRDSGLDKVGSSQSHDERCDGVVFCVLQRYGEEVAVGKCIMVDAEVLEEVVRDLEDFSIFNLLLIGQAMTGLVANVKHDHQNKASIKVSDGVMHVRFRVV